MLLPMTKAGLAAALVECHFCAVLAVPYSGGLFGKTSLQPTVPLFVYWTEPDHHR
jgi:hypothetical protein